MEEYIPLETATPTPTPTSTFPGQCSQPSLQPSIVHSQIDLEAAPLDGEQGTLRSHDMGDTQPMTEEERVVALGSNSMGVHTTQLRNKPKTKKSKPKEFNNRMSPKGLRQLIEKLNDKQKEAVKEIGFGGFLHFQLDMILEKLAVWLVRNFDTCSCSVPLTHGRFRVTEHDVYITLALPKGPFEVTEAKSETNSSTEFKTLLKRWKEQWPDRDSVPKSEEMVDMICSQALLEDAKKASNEIITNTHVLAGVITELEKLVPEAHASLKRVRTIAV
ncbi:hypothetical protein Cgig2_019353 [Carnegiea gigantea]|uniref:Uncharacterized protein n=1 Tax=Carnegiea gigantea TaxID=171969 RepID=A0A9Q1GG97_9CARY|nr:hypothetical protein Cgig2_019353 [Carnegiea gigantea]